MEQLIKINNQQLPVKEYKGQRVVTFKEIDKVHDRPEGTASRNFRRNRDHFVEGEDYFKIQPDEIRRVGIKSPNGGIVLTESGYLMLAKSFTDDLAWTVQRELVNSYFRNKPTPKPEEPEQLTLETMEYHYFDKTYRGEPIITLADFEHFTGIHHSTARSFLCCKCEHNTDYVLLTRGELSEFKIENPGVSRLGSALIVLRRSAVDKLMKYYNCIAKMPKCFIESKTPALPERVRIEPRSKFTAAEYITALQVLNGMKLKEEKYMLKSGNTESEYHKGKVKSLKCAIEIVAVPLSLGFGSPWLGNE